MSTTTHDFQIHPGHYYRWDGTNVESRTTLLDVLEAAPTMSKEQLAPLMNFLQEILATRKRFHHPTPTNGSVTDESAPVSFTLFLKLPKELRDMVFRHALPGGRIFEIWGSTESLTRPSDAKRAHLAVLNIARSCLEAQDLVSKRYEKNRPALHVL